MNLLHLRAAWPNPVIPAANKCLTARWLACAAFRGSWHLAPQFDVSTRIEGASAVVAPAPVETTNEHQC
jgi:hypothetical protein